MTLIVPDTTVKATHIFPFTSSWVGLFLLWTSAVSVCWVFSLPFHLEHPFYCFFLARPSCMLGSLLTERRTTQHKCYYTKAIRLIMKMASEWLKGNFHIGWASSGQRSSPHSKQDRGGLNTILCTIENVSYYSHDFTFNIFWLTAGDGATEDKTTDSRGYCVSPKRQ